MAPRATRTFANNVVFAFSSRSRVLRHSPSPFFNISCSGQQVTSFAAATHLCARHNTPSTDLVVGVSGKQGLAVSGPRQADTVWLLRLLALLDVVGLEFVDLVLLLKVEDGDGGGGSSTEPVSVGREDESMDLIAGLERVEMLGLVQVPEHGGTILAPGGAQGSIGGDGDGVDVAGVADVVGLNAARCEFPNL